MSQTIATMVNTLISQSKTMSPIMLSLWITRMTRRGTKEGLRLSQLFIYLIWEFQNSVVNVGKNCRLFHLGVGGIHVPIFDVVPGTQLIILGSRESHSLDCVVEEHGILWHDSHRLSQTGLAEAFHVLSPKHNLSPFHIKHSEQQLCHRGLSTPRAEMFC